MPKKEQPEPPRCPQLQQDSGPLHSGPSFTCIRATTHGFSEVDSAQSECLQSGNVWFRQRVWGRRAGKTGSQSQGQCLWLLEQHPGIAGLKLSVSRADGCPCANAEGHALRPRAASSLFLYTNTGKYRSDKSACWEAVCPSSMHEGPRAEVGPLHTRGSQTQVRHTPWLCKSDSRLRFPHTSLH